MLLSLDDVIIAPATASGCGLRSIIRLSGDQSLEIARRVFTPADPLQWPPRSSTVIEGQVALTPPWQNWGCQAAVWPDRRSFTCQPSVEFHTPASPWAIELLIARLIEAGARPARPGEFTLRAYLGGRLDLIQAEAVLGVIDANDESSLRASLEQLAGGLSQRLRPLRARLLDLLADVEAGLDFVDEDIEFVTESALRAGIEEGVFEIKRLLHSLDERAELDELPTAVLVGSPNAGKSRLFNRMTRSDRAIVAEVAGTTRDPLVAQIQHRPLRWQLIDTAGLDPARLYRSDVGPVLDSEEGTESEEQVAIAIDTAAQRLALDRIGRADLWLLCVPAGDPEALRVESLVALLSRVDRPSPPMLSVITMVDRAAQAEVAADAWPTSSETGEGIEPLMERIEQILATARRGSAGVASTGLRARGALLRCLERLGGALAALDGGLGEEWVAAELRGGLDELGTVTGEIHTEDLLERIFARFCIGK